MGKSFLLPLICHLLIPDGELSPKVLIGKSRLRSEVNRGENYELLLMIITISIATVMMFDDDGDDGDDDNDDDDDDVDGDDNDDEDDLKCRLLAVGPNAISSQLRRLLDVAAQMDNNLVVRG